MERRREEPCRSMELEKDYILQLYTVGSGVEGEVVMRNRNEPGTGTHLFHVPLQGSEEEAASWAHTALRAIREG
ncbi:hypothetical protein J2T17_002364 [Paenibacillus mucilaginosus]|uniref:hypothetical protein n=1 Tax=Paenibacillus mucilaginosus TaxID=61624 RepID=UPI003D212DA2